MVSTFCFGPYLIAKRAPPEVAAQAAKLHIIIGALAMLVVYLLREPLGGMVEAPEMGRFVPGFALAQMIDRVRYIQGQVAPVDAAGDEGVAGLDLERDRWRREVADVPRLRDLPHRHHRDGHRGMIAMTRVVTIAIRSVPL